MGARAITALAKKVDLVPDEHDGSYELVRATVKALSTIDEKDLGIEDLDLLYFSTVGTFSRSFSHKKTCIEKSNLGAGEKEGLKELLNKIRERANDGAYSNHGRSDTIGMFGTGIGTLKVDSEGIKRFINLCTDIADLDNEDVILDIGEAALKNDIKGLGIAPASQILHCLKPYVFPILNDGGQSGIDAFMKMGVNLIKPQNITFYIQNTRTIRKFRNENFKFRNYRVIDRFFWDYSMNNYWLFNVNFKSKFPVWDYCRNNNCFIMQYQYGVEDSSSVTRNINVAKKVRKGDFCLAYTGQRSIVGLGKVTREFYEEDNPQEFAFAEEPWAQRIGVKWDLISDIPLEVDDFFEKMAVKKQNTLHTCAINGIEEKGFEYVKRILSGDREQNGGQNDVPKGYSRSQFIEEVFVDEEKYKEIIYSLKSKKNIILQGPPGVGKTFAAKRIAYAMMGSKDDNRIEMIQFHQSYAYEDFIQGFRPAKDGTFELRNGVFYNFCLQARNDPENDYFFIIDEINRGNLSKAFGELMLLLEFDKRGEEFAIYLTYSEGEKFYVPENIYLIGTMNTADRSLAMVDYALRRRFRFISLEPAFDSNKFISYLRQNKLDIQSIEKIRTKMNALNSKIRDDTRGLGKGYEIGHSYFCTKPMPGKVLRVGIKG